MRALLAPYDKTGLIDFAKGLVGLGWELIATGNTERQLREAGLPVISVAEVIGFPSPALSKRETKPASDHRFPSVTPPHRARP